MRWSSVLVVWVLLVLIEYTEPSPISCTPCSCSVSQLNCDNQGLKEVPNWENEFVKVILSHNQIGKLSETSFKNYRNLVHLDLSYNGLKSVSHLIFANLQNLSNLNLTGNHIPCNNDTYRLIRLAAGKIVIDGLDCPTSALSIHSVSLESRKMTDLRVDRKVLVTLTHSCSTPMKSDNYMLSLSYLTLSRVIKNINKVIKSTTMKMLSNLERQLRVDGSDCTSLVYSASFKWNVPQSYNESYLNSALYQANRKWNKERLFSDAVTRLYLLGASPFITCYHCTSCSAVTSNTTTSSVCGACGVIRRATPSSISRVCYSSLAACDNTATSCCSRDKCNRGRAVHSTDPVILLLLAVLGAVSA